MALRPTSWPLATQPPATPQTGSAGNARAAAQRAFFEALKSQGVSTPAPSAQPAAVQAHPAPRAGRAPDLTIQMPEDPPQKILRPGSIIDIRV